MKLASFNTVSLNNSISFQEVLNTDGIVKFTPQEGYILKGVTPGYHKFTCRIITETNGIYRLHRLKIVYDTSSRDSSIPIGKGVEFLTYNLFEKFVERPRFELITPKNSVRFCFSHIFDGHKILIIFL